MKVSLIIPSRNERFLVPTVQDVLRHAAGELEVLVVLDGYWDTNLPNDPRVRVIHKGQAEGMRRAINDAARIATGDYLMKLDAHCSVSEGFDEVLQAQCDGDWIVVPRRDRLDAEQWCKQETGKPPIDAHFLSYPFERPGDGSCGLHGTIWKSRAATRTHILLDEEMSSQGSCWFMSRGHWNRLGEMDYRSYGNFVNEFQELGLKTWLGGGKVMVNKSCQYLHLHKGKTYGRGYPLTKHEQQRGSDFTTRYWMLDQWAERVHNLRWLIERFAPVPTWPDDLDAAFATAREVLRAA